MNYTHYDYLELPPGASLARIEAAYAQILARFDAGVTQNRDDLSLLVRRIHAAYEVLHDDGARKAYDELLDAQAQQADAELKADLDRQVVRPLRRVQEVPATLNTAFSALAA
ncbi:MAG: DnaJ domain-containing protein [Proteobacteria bacterium]|nr:DnaJ domain-containing protein [Pseudomonadota bacterium]